MGIRQAHVAQIENDPGSISVDKFFQVLHMLDAKLVVVDAKVELHRRMTLPPAKEPLSETASYGNEEIRAMSQGARYSLIAQQIKKAQTQYRIESTPDTLLFCTLALAAGVDFDQEPFIARVLKEVSEESAPLGETYLRHLRTQGVA